MEDDLLEQFGKQDKFFVKSEGKYHALRKNDICWIYAEGNYCTLHTTDSKEFVIKCSLTRIKQLLGADTFFKVHRNYMINISKIELYDPTGTVWINNTAIPVSRNNKKQLEEQLNFLL